MGRDRRNFTNEFKQQMVSLFNNGKPRNEIIKECDLTPSSLNNWIKRFIVLAHLKLMTVVQMKKRDYYS